MEKEAASGQTRWPDGNGANVFTARPARIQTEHRVIDEAAKQAGALGHPALSCLQVRLCYSCPVGPPLAPATLTRIPGPLLPGGTRTAVGLVPTYAERIQARNRRARNGTQICPINGHAERGEHARVRLQNVCLNGLSELVRVANANTVQPSWIRVHGHWGTRHRG